MATILDILIQILNIDCSVVQCSGYASEIEAMFYLFFFPTIFIILFIYILTSFIFRGGGRVRGMKLLIAIGVYAFIVFEHMFTSVVAISRLWWLLTIILVGLFAFLRFLFTGGREGEGRGGLPFGRQGFLRRTLEGVKEEHVEKTVKDILDIEKSEDKIRRNAFKKLRKLMESVDYDVTKFNEREQKSYEELCDLSGINPVTMFGGKSSSDIKKMFEKSGG